VTACREPTDALFDVVIGNPPYGRVALTAAQRRYFARGLFVHANLYGLFTDIAMRWTKRPRHCLRHPAASWAGDTQALRSLLAAEAPPLAAEFRPRAERRLRRRAQETLLATYRKGGRSTEPMSTTLMLPPIHRRGSLMPVASIVPPDPAALAGAACIGSPGSDRSPLKHAA